MLATHGANMLRQAFFALLCVVSVIAKCSLADEDQALMRALQVVNSTTARAQSGLNLLHELVGYRSDVVTQHRRVLSVCQTSWESSRADYEAMQAQVADLKRQPDAKVSLPDSPAGLLGRFNAYTDHLSVIQRCAVHYLCFALSRILLSMVALSWFAVKRARWLQILPKWMLRRQRGWWRSHAMLVRPWL